MSKSTDTVKTPKYVLKSENQSVGPTISFEEPDTHYVCVYGFSSKVVYDQFVKNAAQAMTPFPLVPGYLSNQVEEASSAQAKGRHLRLVVLDATDPAEPVLAAASMATVLLAHQEKGNQVSVEFELVLDPETAAYRM